MVAYNTLYIIYRVLTEQNGCSISINPTNALVLNFKGSIVQNKLHTENPLGPWVRYEAFQISANKVHFQYCQWNIAAITEK